MVVPRPVANPGSVFGEMDVYDPPLILERPQGNWAHGQDGRAWVVDFTPTTRHELAVDHVESPMAIRSCGSRAAIGHGSTQARVDLTAKFQERRAGQFARIMCVRRLSAILGPPVRISEASIPAPARAQSQRMSQFVASCSVKAGRGCERPHTATDANAASRVLDLFAIMVLRPRSAAPRTGIVPLPGVNDLDRNPSRIASQNALPIRYGSGDHTRITLGQDRGWNSAGGCDVAGTVLGQFGETWTAYLDAADRREMHRMKHVRDSEVQAGVALGETGDTQLRAVHGGVDDVSVMRAERGGSRTKGSHHRGR